ncbi:Xaa-Pro dipeptidyl-peptidase [Allokutzneria albata]|uniref:Xaa-Pro dipeptidyl-peptidase n=1 Tax=Allokutzneria albata TaxID=211114 RepID=A0A1H0BB75_ALLAB|nr:Xaa-Pro dipeptidyl-peptidase [Allokutzneria albata]SDN42895.1 X-Pro dipeptidyl-peptidase [Allokutzneria albata]
MLRRIGVLAGLLALISSTVAVPASARVLPGGLSQPVHALADAVRETVWVDIGLDGDRDGVRDRVAADIVRPQTTAKVPVIMDASPYYSCCGRGNESERKTYDASGRPVGFPLFYDNYFVPRGYSVVLVDLAGTNRSEGCVDVGGRSDVTSAKAVVDWLNGRSAGYDSKAGGKPVQATWSTGAVGMIGKSYDGTIANGVAATGVDGLRTIVPIGAISSWYDYYRGDGVPFRRNGPSGLARTVESGGRADCGHAKTALDQGAKANGDFTPMWAERNHVPDASKVKASVFVVHGLGDLNVMTLHFGQWWDALAKAGVKRKIWLSQAGHVDPFDFRRAEWVRTLHRWFDHTLLGVANGIDTEPMADVERAPDTWVTDKVWPPTAKLTSVRPQPGTAAGLGKLATAPAAVGKTEQLTDDGRTNEFSWALQPNTSSPSRVLFTTGSLSEEVRLSGTGSVTVTASSSTPTAHLTVALVHYGPTTIRDYRGSGEGIRTLGTESCWGENRDGDNACYKDTATTTKQVDHEVLARGWADLSNHASLNSSTPLRPGQSYPMTFRLSALDHVIPAGHQLAVIIGGTDDTFITAPAQLPRITVDLSRTSFDLPLVGGLPAASGEQAPEARSGMPAPSALPNGER